MRQALSLLEHRYIIRYATSSHIALYLVEFRHYDMVCLVKSLTFPQGKRAELDFICSSIEESSLVVEEFV